MNPDLSSLDDPIVVSGLGLVTPIGNNVQETWASLLQSKVGYKKETAGFMARVALPDDPHVSSRGAQFALAATAEALVNARLMDKLSSQNVLFSDRKNKIRIGSSVSQSKPVILGQKNLNQEHLLSSFFGLSFPDVISKHYSLSGPALNVVAACATGIVSMLVGIQWLLAGDVDVVLTGASESSLNLFYQTGFKNLGVLATGSEVTSVCPFDKSRTGFAMGEGAAVLVLERASHAKVRNHKPLVFVRGLQMRQSRQDSLKFNSEGNEVAALIKSIFKSQKSGEGMTGRSPLYVNAHGTGTVGNDLAEVNGMAKAFEKNQENVFVSSTKSMTGHLLGAAGALEAALSVLSITQGVIPHTQHLKNIDNDFSLNFVKEAPLKMPVSRALSLSYGFGGQMGAVFFSKV